MEVYLIERIQKGIYCQIMSVWSSYTLAEKAMLLLQTLKEPDTVFVIHRRTMSE